MKSNVLSEVLRNHGGCREDDGALKSGDQELTLYVSVGNTMLALERVVWVKVDGESVAVQTRADRYVFTHEDIRGIRLANAKGGVGYSS